MRSANLSILSLGLGVVLGAGVAWAAPFTPGNLVVYRVGDGISTLANTGNAVFIDEFTTSGSLVQSVALPTADGGGNFGLVASGTASSEGLLTVSPDGSYIAVTGYRSVHTSSLTSSTGATINRTVGIIPVSTGAPSITTALSDFSTGSNPRSAVTTNGTDLWLAGGAGGLRYATAGASSSTQINTGTNAITNLRQLNIFDGQLYVTTASGSAVRLGAVGAGTPTTNGQNTASLPGLPTSGGGPYGFFFADLDATVAGSDTLYIADDTALALTKYSLVSGSWVSNGTIGVDADDYRGLTGYVAAPGQAQLFAIRKGGSSSAGGGELVTILDTTGYNANWTSLTPTLLASASTGQAANTAFRGVGYLTPIPEPASLALLAMGGLLLFTRRR